MPIALTPRGDFKYVLACERNLPVDKQTIFHLRALTVDERARLKDQFVRCDVPDGADVKSYFNTAGTRDLTAVRLGLVGWSNFKDAKGADVKFETNREGIALLGRFLNPPTDACLAMLREEHLSELADQVLTINTLTEADRKN